MFRFIDLVK